jgi:hypothetical protein
VPPEVLQLAACERERRRGSGRSAYDCWQADCWIIAQKCDGFQRHALRYGRPRFLRAELPGVLATWTDVISPARKVSSSMRNLFGGGAGAVSLAFHKQYVAAGVVAATS